jgi:ubiquinone/menaquinone biosynthesis C-methylase UbiE
MWRSPINRAVLDLVDPRPGELVVDIGAGMGPATVAAARRGAQVIAVDPTPYMRRILALRRLAQRARDRIRVSEGSAEHLPCGEASCDAAWAVNSMHHWTDVEHAVREIARVVKPGGRIVLVDEDFEDPRHPLFDKTPLRRHDDEEHGMEAVDLEDMRHRLEAYGCTEVVAAIRDLADLPCRVVTATRG